MTGSQVRGEGWRPAWARWAMVGGVLLGAALGLHELATDSLWLDEIWTASAAQAPDLGGVLDYLGRWNDVRPLHFLLVHLLTWMGDGEFWLRVPSVGFGLLSLVLTYQVGRVLFGRREGLWAAFLLAQSALFVHYMQEARTYTLLVCISLLSLYCFDRAWRLGRWLWWAAFVAASILNAYTHYFAAFVLASELVVGAILLVGDFAALRDVAWRERLSLSARPGRRLVALAASLAVIGLALLPSIPEVVEFVSAKAGGETLTQGLDWSIQFWVDVVNQFSVGDQVGTQITLLAWTLLGLCLVGLLAGTLQRQYRALFWLLTWIALPFVVLFLFPSRHFFHIRYVLHVLPILLLGAARGITAVIDLVRSAPILTKRRVLGPLMVAVITIGFLAAGSAPLHAWYAQIRQPWRDLAAFFRAQMLPGEVLLVEPPWYAEPLAYYGFASALAVKGSPDRFREYARPATGVWFLRSAHKQADPSGEIRRWIDAEGYTRLWYSERSIGQMSLYYKQQAVGGTRDLVPVLVGLEQVDPANPEIHHLLAGEYRQRGQFAAARAEYERARQIEPDNPRWLVLLGRAWAEEGAPERGLVLVQQGIALAPDNASFWIILGDVHRQSGRTAEAIAAYEQALALDADNRQAARKLKDLRP